jgi:hypothetical protein
MHNSYTYNSENKFSSEWAYALAYKTVQVANKFIHRQQLQSLATTPARIKVVLEDFHTCDRATVHNIDTGCLEDWIGSDSSKKR